MLALLQYKLQANACRITCTASSSQSQVMHTCSVGMQQHCIQAVLSYRQTNCCLLCTILQGRQSLSRSATRLSHLMRLR
jgi:hypothetical protein